MHNILSQQFLAARAVGVPLLSVKTFDCEALMQSLQRVSNEHPLIQWDVIRGWKHRNDSGEGAINSALDSTAIEATISPVEQLILASKLEEGCVLFLINAHRYLDRA